MSRLDDQTGATFQDLRELMDIDPREGFEMEGSVCLGCENGYHDDAVEVAGVMKCSCPCHAGRAIAVGQ